MRPKVPFIVIRIAVPMLLFALSLAAGVPAIKSRPKIYEAHARVWIQAQLGLGSNEGGNAGQYMPFTTSFNSPIVTAAEIIRSGEVVSKAIDLYKERYPFYKYEGSPEALQGALSVAPIKDTDILMVKCVGRTGDQASHMLECVLDAFVKLSTNQSSANAARSKLYAEKQLSEARVRLSSVTRTLERFQLAHNISDMKSNAADLLQQQQEAEDKVREDKILIAHNREQISRLGEKVQSCRENKTNINIAEELENRIAQLHLRIMEASHTLKAGHPFILRSQQKIAEMEENLREVRSRCPQTDKGELGKVEEELREAEKSLNNAESDYNNRIVYLEALKIKVRNLPSEQFEWAELNRQKQLAEDQVSELERKAGTAALIASVAQNATNIKVIDHPSLPDIPTGPGGSIIMVVTATVAVVLSTLAFIGMGRLDPAVSSAQFIAAYLPWTFACSLSISGQLDKSRIEKLRWFVKKALATTKRIVMMSAEPGAGKTKVITALAMSLAQNGSKVLLIDANSVHPELHERFKIPLSPGIFDYGAKPVDGLIHEVADNLYVIPAGNIHQTVSTFEVPHVKEFLALLEGQYDGLIFDTAANSVAHEGLLLMDGPSTAVLATRIGSTSKQAFLSLAADLQERNITSGLHVTTGSDNIDIMVTNTPDSPKSAAGDSAPKPAVDKAGEEEPSVW
jgi:Mrp family chromosome partitioning ATPase